MNNTKKGFAISIGCKRKKNRSIHRFDPLTSRPINGTKSNKISENKNKGIIIFLKKVSSNRK